jgi:membrane-bound metal-dependent hydrolase YbcI (DUF457 family)
MGQLTGEFWPWVLGSIIADIDHIYIYMKSGARNIKGLIDRVKNEGKYGIKSRTPLFHSLIGVLVISGLSYFIFRKATIFFLIGYLSHLILDWPDKDQTPILWPLRYEFKGPLQVWSKPEKIITFFAIIILILLFLPL